MKKNVTLIGMPGSGKSTVGVVLAKVLGYHFVDSDLVIQEQTGKLLHELITEYGDEGFLEIENKVNDIILQNLPVSVEYLTQEEAEKMFDLSRLPKDASQTLRIVKIGDYDACPCIGVHVNNTSEIGRFNIVSSDFFDGRLRIRFNLLI